MDMPEHLQVNGEKYRLKSFVVHSGAESKHEHYSFLVWKEDEWIRCNNTSIKHSLNIKADRINGYIYIYERIIV